jgi:uncharacterized membrane protein
LDEDMQNPKTGVIHMFYGFEVNSSLSMLVKNILDIVTIILTRGDYRIALHCGPYCHKQEQNKNESVST